MEVHTCEKNVPMTAGVTAVPMVAVLNTMITGFEDDTRRYARK